MNNEIVLSGINKRFGNTVVLDNRNCAFNKGTITTIFGNSGAGKTTLLNIIGLIEEQDAGTVRIFGETKPAVKSKEARLWRREKMGYLFQNFGLLDDQDVNSNLDLALAYKKISKKEKQQLKESALAEVNLSKNYLNKRVYSLSGGEQQRVALAKVILKDVEIILADEPTGSLDTTNKEIIMALLVKLNRSGKTIIVVSHDKDFKNISDSVLNL